MFARLAKIPAQPGPEWEMTSGMQLMTKRLVGERCMRNFKNWLLLAWIGLCWFPTGCRAPRTVSEAGKPSMGYPVRGVVEKVEPATGGVLLKHEAIAGLMPAMTMEYPLENPSELSELHPGDRITATVLADPGPNGPHHLRLTELDVISQGKPDESAPAGQFHLPAVGELVPDFVLLDQSGRQLHLKELRGKVVAMTFIYTRCPVADYCPRMSRNFAQIDQALRGDPALYGKTHLLSVSFDPGYDTPAVLRSYGGAYTGQYTREKFAHWSFAAPSLRELPAMQHWFGVGITPISSGNLQHSLSTVIVGEDGRVAAFYPSNEWTVAEALSAIRSAAARS